MSEVPYSPLEDEGTCRTQRLISSCVGQRRNAGKASTAGNLCLTRISAAPHQGGKADLVRTVRAHRTSGTWAIVPRRASQATGKGRPRVGLRPALVTKRAPTLLRYAKKPLEGRGSWCAVFGEEHAAEALSWSSSVPETSLTPRGFLAQREGGSDER